VRPLEAEEELVVPRRCVGDGQEQRTVAMLARLEGTAGHAGQLVSARQTHFEGSWLALDNGHFDQGDHAHVRFAQREHGEDITQRARFACRGHERAVAHRPPHLGRRIRVERGLDERAAVGRRPSRDETGRQTHVGLLAWEIDRCPRRARWRHRQRERCAAGRIPQRRAPFERHYEWARTGQERRVRIAICDERQWTSGKAGVDERRAREKRDAVDAAPEHVAGNGEGAARRASVDAHAQVGTGEHCRHRRSGWFLGRTVRQVDEPIVFRQRQHDRPRLRRARWLLRGCRGRRDDHERKGAGNVVRHG
jgi:hypothetical protein